MYRVKIKVVEFVLVHVGEPLLIGVVGAPLGVGTVATSDAEANATIVVLIGASTDDNSAVAFAATTSANSSSSCPIATR